MLSDIRSVAAGVTFGVQNVSGTTLDISGSSVIVSSVDLPTSMTAGTVSIATGSDFALGGFTCATGMKIKNFAGFTQSGGAILAIKDSANSDSLTADYFLMQIGEEIFIETSNIDRLRFRAFEDSGDSTVIMTYQAS